MRNARKSSSELEIKVGDRKIVDINSIKPWKDNPHNEDAVPWIVKSVKLYGQRSSIVVWEKTGEIGKGNTTWKAMKKAGFTKCAVDFAEFKDRTEFERYAMIDNKAGEKAGYDQEAYITLMQSETMRDAQPDELGLTEKEFSSIMLSAVKPEKLPDVDIQGIQTGISSVLILQFDTEQEMEHFKTEIMGINQKTQKIIKYSDLKEKLDPVFSGSKSGRKRRSR